MFILMPGLLLFAIIKETIVEYMSDLYNTIHPSINSIMLNRIDLGNRLKQLRKTRQFSQQFVAENLFISQAAYSLIENSQNGIVAEHVVGLSELYDVTTDYILKGDNHLIRISPLNGFVPYVKIKAHAGYVKNLSKEITTEDYEWYRIPGFNATLEHRLFEAEGESMIPTIFPGDVVITQKQNKWDQILDGSLVIIGTKESLLIKRFKETNEPDVFIFENDNPDSTEELSFSIHEIKEIMMVRGKISNVLAPHHQNGTNGKIKTMEESIEFLRKELLSITKKLNLKEG
ncbi:S24 family peptidase [Gillisia limnaea]|uniref:Helix-turn-helix domain protein n=2 Tax=Gillisia TaxID=244698 RepID=H2C065_GILLR|nr:helix-turn-helix domain protein [Gillisia limnaea DSM 15749]